MYPVIPKQCTTLGIHYSTWSKHGGKWRDRRREKHCQFSFSWINTTTQTWSLRLKSNDFQVMPWEKQQLVEEKDEDSIRKVPCKSFIQWFHSFSFVFFCCCWSTLKWKSRNITKHLMSGPSGNQLVLFSLESWCFRDKVEGNIRTLGKTKLTVSLGIWH